MMKRYILSILVVVAFASYVFYQQIGGGTVVVNSNNQNSLDLVTVNVPAQTPIPKPTPKLTQIPTPTPKPIPTPVTPPPVAVVPKGQYKDGSYIGISADAYYGYIQVKAIISGGKLVDVQFLDHPQDRGTSIRINDYAMPQLKQEAISIQSANVDGVSGATDSSGAFRQSLGSALAQARNV